MATTLGLPLDVFSTCPPSNGVNASEYLERVIDVARWSDRHGCRGILIYSDNSQLDAWSIAQVVLQNTRSLAPLVAVQPVYMHPFTLAKMVATLSSIYQRRLYLNLVAGGFKNDLVALNDTTPHDRRYERLVEYARIVNGLVAGTPFSFDGEFYRVDKLTLTPTLAPALRPALFVSGSSDAGLAAARAISATAIKYPKPARQEPSNAGEDLNFGIRVGIVARPRERDAWDAAHARFPDSRRGQLTRQLATKVSDSIWHKELSALPQTGQSTYWLAPFENYQTMCPYLVGSYGQVADELTTYLSSGYRTVILDVPPSADDLQHTFAALATATEEVA